MVCVSQVLTVSFCIYCIDTNTMASTLIDCAKKLRIHRDRARGYFMLPHTTQVRDLQIEYGLRRLEHRALTDCRIVCDRSSSG